MKCTVHTLGVAMMSIGLTWFTGCEQQPDTPAERLNETIDEIQETVEDAGHDARDTAEEIGVKLDPDHAKSLGEKVEEGIQQGGEAVKEGVENAKDATGDALQKAGEKLEEAGDAIQDGVEKAGEKVKETAEKAADAASGSDGS